MYLLKLLFNGVAGQLTWTYFSFPCHMKSTHSTNRVSASLQRNPSCPINVPTICSPYFPIPPTLKFTVVNRFASLDVGGNWRDRKEKFHKERTGHHNKTQFAGAVRLRARPHNCATHIWASFVPGIQSRLASKTKVGKIIAALC